MTYSFTVSPRELVWLSSDSHAKTMTVGNTGTEDFLVEVAAPLQNGPHEFVWSYQPPQRVAPAGTYSLTVHPPVPGPGTGPKATDITVTLRYPGSNAVYQVYTLKCRNNGVGRINYGDVAFSAIVFDPAGSDIDGEGEYLEILNLTTRELDFGQSTLSQMVFGSRTYTAAFAAFSADASRTDFGRTCRLAPGATLRVLTRRRPVADPNGATRYYLDRPLPVWNNTGDRATLTNEFGEMVATFGYLSQGRDANLPVAPVPFDPGTGAPQTVFKVLTVQVEAQAEEGVVMMDGAEEFKLLDGDTVTISTNERNIVLEYLATNNVLPGTAGFWAFSPEFVPSGRRLIFPNRQGPAENTSPNDAGFPMPGGPHGALVASIDRNGSYFLVGEGTKFRFTSDRPSVLTLLVNDNYWIDNRGAYVATVTIER